MAEYVPIVRCERWDLEPIMPAGDALMPEIVVDDSRPIRTGLLDAHGVPLYRLPNRMGF